MIQKSQIVLFVNTKVKVRSGCVSDRLVLPCNRLLHQLKTNPMQLAIEIVYYDIDIYIEKALFGSACYSASMYLFFYYQ